MNDAQGPLQGAELWVPQGDTLVLRAGAYGPNTEFARVSAKSHFRSGEGLPGAIWASERAQVWHDLKSHFVRSEVAAASGIDAALGFPWWNGRELAGVVTLLFTTATTLRGCVEVWNHDAAVEVLRHGGGMYANTPEFERLSSLVQFPYAAGLPGLTWSGGMPVLVEDVRASNEFVRAELAVRAGLKRAVGVPIFRERKVMHVLTFLGGETRSFLRAFELFVEGEHGLTSKLCAEETGDSTPASRPSAPRERELMAREARYSRLPMITSPASAGSRDPLDPRSDILLTLPIHDGTRLRGVACLEF